MASEDPSFARSNVRQTLKRRTIGQLARGCGLNTKPFRAKSLIELIDRVAARAA